MRVRNLSVAKKTWLLLLVVVVPLLLTGLWMATYLRSIEQQEAQVIAQVQTQNRLVRELRAEVEVAIGNLLAASLADSGEGKLFFDKRFQASVEKVKKLLAQVGSSITTEQGRAYFQSATKARDQLYVVIGKVQSTEAEGAELLSLVMQQLIPAVSAYQAELSQLADWQDQQVLASTAQAQQQEQQAVIIGVAVLVAVFLLDLWMAVWLVRQLTQPLRRAVELANHIAEGDLSREVQDDRFDELGQLLRSLGAMSARLREVVGQVRVGVDAVSSAASEIASGGQNLSTRTEQAAANLEETAASIEQLTATVGQAAETARQASQLAETAVQAAERGGDVVSQVVKSMAQINASSQKINDIIGVIDGIAFQTNILALNAAVEAARAGEQGRGFAVVAAEVRSLAQRSAQAAKEVKELISTSVSNVDAGSSQVAQAGQSMQEIVGSVRRVTDLIAEITAAANEQSDGINQVNQAVGNLDQMTQQNAALVEESSSAATAMQEQSQKLAQVVAVFNLGQGQAAAPLQLGGATPPLKLAAARSTMLAVGQLAPRAELPKIAGHKPKAKVGETAASSDGWESF